MINAASEINDETLVEIVLTGIKIPTPNPRESFPSPGKVGERRFMKLFITCSETGEFCALFTFPAMKTFLLLWLLFYCFWGGGFLAQFLGPGGT